MSIHKHLSSNDRRRRLLNLALLLFAVLAWPSVAVELRDNHPQRYQVQPGDNLWGIAGRYLNDPWRWPEIWRANPDVANPNRIYPGDVLVVSYDQGRPQVSVASEIREVRLQPRVRVTELDAAIPTIPISSIAPFLTRGVITSADDIENAPYVVGFPDGRAIAASGDQAYVRKIMAPIGQRYDILRPGSEYRDYTTGEALGFEAAFVASAILERQGDPAILQIGRTMTEVAIGDRVRPAADEDRLRDFIPHPAPATLRGHIISVLGGVTQIGQYAVVVLDRGSQQGVKPGMVFAIYRGGETRRDPVRNRSNQWNWRNQSPLDSAFWYGDHHATGWSRRQPTTDPQIPLHVEARRLTEEYLVPDQIVGNAMVFRTFDRLSFALIMSATHAMQVGALVGAPD